MKRRAVDPIDREADPLEQLCAALLALQDRTSMRAFLQDLCTPAELEALGDRWRVVPLLLDEVPYREIHERTAVSVTTIGRVARSLVEGRGYRAAAAGLGLALDALPADTGLPAR